uniref:Uncharacterized protein n=1 Tax=Anopheles funestus TaxID=62324 RepID=A0A182S2B6_ANOFN
MHWQITTQSVGANGNLPSALPFHACL